MKEHDFSKQRWGYHIEPFGDDKKEITKRFLRKSIVRGYREYWGHASGLKEQDKIKLKDRDGHIIKYTIRNLRYEKDPWDMFFFTIYFDEIEIDDT